MTSVEYSYTQPFIESVTREYTDPETDETVTKTFEYERVPIRLYTRKWQQTGDNQYKLWLRVTVTKFGDRLSNSGVPENVTAPDWYDEMTEKMDAFIDGVYSGELKASVIENVVEDVAVTVERMASDGDDLLVDVVVEADSFPVVAEFTGSSAKFSPTGGDD